MDNAELFDTALPGRVKAPSNNGRLFFANNSMSTTGFLGKFRLFGQDDGRVLMFVYPTECTGGLCGDGTETVGHIVDWVDTWLPTVTDTAIAGARPSANFAIELHPFNA